MKRVLGAAVSALALMATDAALQAGPAHAATAAAPKGVVVPPLNYKVRTLANGLKIYTLKDPSASNVTVQVWYGVGSKDDPEGRSGFAHLFEHMMFKSTKNLPPEFFDRLTEDVGGFNNAFTAADMTPYYEVVPANHLERLLFAEAERMGSLVVDEDAFKSERDVVKEELRQRVLASPYGRLFYLELPRNSYVAHPYRRPGIGSIEELDAATIDDVRRFHATYYRPDNANLIVAGDFDEAQLDRWVDKYFSGIKDPSTPIPKNNVTEPARPGPRTVELYAPNVPLPAVLISYPGVRYADPDAPAMQVLDAIMGKGESSRLYRSLVYEKQVAAQQITNVDVNQQAGSYALGAILAGGKTIAEGEAAVLAEVAKLRDAPVTAAELTEAKNELVADALRSRETVDGRAMALGNAIILAGDPKYADTEIERIQAVTAADIQRIARKYLRDDARVVLRYQDEKAKPAGQTVAAAAAPTAVAPVKLADLVKTPEVFTLLPEAQRTPPPSPAAERPVVTPLVTERTLANGLRVIVAPTKGLPLVSARLSFEAGAWADPAGKAGTADLAATLVTQGTTTKSAPQIASAIEALGADVGANATADFSSVYANAPTNVFPQAAAIMADMVRNPVFAAEELERQRSQALDNLKVQLSQPGTIAGQAMGRVVYGAAPYGSPSAGTVTSVPKLTRADLAAFHAQRWRPSVANLVFSGDITPEAAFALAEKLFGTWRDPAGAKPPAPTGLAGANLPPRAVVIDQPGAGQAAVVAAVRSIRRDDPRYYPLLLGNSILGQGFSSRLNQEIRIKRGLSYGAGSQLAARRDQGLWAATTQTKNESAVEVTDLVLAEIKKLTAEPPAEAELASRRAVLVGTFGRSLETVDGLGSLVAGFANYRLPLTELRDYPQKVRAVTAAEIQTAAGQTLVPANMSLLVVGDAKVFLPGLKAKYPNLEVVELSGLNLDSATLK